MLEKKLNELRMAITHYAEHVENMIQKSLKGLLKKDEKLLKEVIHNDEPIANKEELKIDELCIDFIAMFSPKAGPLRLALMILKMNNDFERMADHAVNISESALYLIKKPEVKPLIDIPRMAEIATGMLKDATKAFLNGDSNLARDVCERDNLVDALRDQITRELVTYMTSDPGTIERSLHLLRISGNLERIADLATNIAEDVVFIVEGKTIKHGHI